MPIADFQDDITNEVFELLFKSNPIPDQVIHEKTGNTATRLMSKPSGFIFVGPGFYATEYKNSK